MHQADPSDAEYVTDRVSDGHQGVRKRLDDKTGCVFTSVNVDITIYEPDSQPCIGHFLETSGKLLAQLSEEPMNNNKMKYFE